MDEPMPVAGEQRTRRKNAGRPLGRRALCWAVGLFALSQAALALWIPRDGFLVRDPVRHDRLKMLRRRMAEAPAPPELVILLGSSHVRYSLFSRRLGVQASAALGRPVVVANQAMDGAASIRSLLAMDRLLREGVVPDLVVLETFPYLFGLPDDYETGVDILPATSLDTGDVELIRRYAPGRPDLAEMRYPHAATPVYAQRSNLTNFLVPWLLLPARRRQKLPEEYDFPYDDPSAGRRANAIAVAKEGYSPRLQNLSLGEPRLVGAVNELVGKLRARGSRVVFLAMPEGPAFRSWYPPDRWAASVVWLRDLAALHGVPLIDARQWTDDEALFSDSHHLTKGGSERFSRWLTREVLVPQLRAAE